MVLRVADSLALKLIALKPDGQAEVATELAGTLEFEVEKWELDHVRTLVTEFVHLARLAQSQEQALFVWMHPLQT